MGWQLFKAEKGRKKWSIRGVLWNGVTVKLSGHQDKMVAEHIMRNIASLNRSRHLGETPDPNLIPWIGSLSEREVERLISFELVPLRFLDKRRPIEDLLQAFLIHSKSKCEDQSVSPDNKVSKVRRVFAAIGPDATFEDLEEDQVNNLLKKMVALSGKRKGKPLSQKTRREYIFAIKSFCEWMVKKRGANKNPLESLVAPAAKGAPVLNRRPMKADDFSILMNYLRTAPARYPNQIFSWTPEDRLMIYWTAAKTGFRATELRSLTRASFDFDANPVLVTVEGWVAKNRTKAIVPITDSDFVHALKEYASRQLPNTPLLRIPGGKALTRGLYRDLEAAGVRRKFDDGAIVDFHTLRSTAIYWWLKERIDLLGVQRRARLKTLVLVQQYVINHVPEYLEQVHQSREANEKPTVLRAI